MSKGLEYPIQVGDYSFKRLDDRLIFSNNGLLGSLDTLGSFVFIAALVAHYFAPEWIPRSITLFLIVCLVPLNLYALTMHVLIPARNFVIYKTGFHIGFTKVEPCHLESMVIKPYLNRLALRVQVGSKNSIIGTFKHCDQAEQAAQLLKDAVLSK